MKKGFVALLLVLALVVLISPGIIGRLAENSVDDSLDWAVSDSSDILVTTTGFERSWFTSAGQHRIELLPGDLYYTLLAAFASAATDTLPVLIIDTHLDHGLIPVSSMARENGSLMPGLGSAISTLAIELADGSVLPVPGTLFSRVGLTGELQSRFVLEPGGIEADGVKLDWGETEFLFTTNPNSGSVGVVGALDSLAIESADETMIVDKLEVDVDLAATSFGFMVGPAKITLDSLAIVSAEEATTAGPLYLESDSSIEDGRLNADVTFRIENAPVPTGGSGGMELVMRLEEVDAEALGKLKRSIEAMPTGAVDAAARMDMETELMRVLASGMKLHFDQLDVSTPMGQFTSRLSAVVAASEDDDYTWASALMVLDASAEFSFPEALVDLAIQFNPDLSAAIGMGFLRKRDDFYVMEAAFKQGLLTVNGAPMPVPLTGWQ